MLKSASSTFCKNSVLFRTTVTFPLSASVIKMLKRNTAKFQISKY